MFRQGDEPLPVLRELVGVQGLIEQLHHRPWVVYVGPNGIGLELCLGDFVDFDSVFSGHVCLCLCKCCLG